MTSPTIYIDRDDTSVKTLAIKLGAYAGLSDCIASNAKSGPHTAITATRHAGMALVLCLYGGFADPADNGWLCMATPDQPGAVDGLLSMATRCFNGQPQAVLLNSEGWN